MYTYMHTLHVSLIYQNKSSHLMHGCLKGLNDISLSTDSWMGNIPPIIISPGAVTAWTLLSCCSAAHPTSRFVNKSVIWTWIHREISAMLLLLLLLGFPFPSRSFLVACLSVIICLQQSDTPPFQYHRVEKTLPFPPMVLQFSNSSLKPCPFLCEWWLGESF